MKTKQKATKKILAEQEIVLQTERDVRDALLIVSVAANLFVVCLWVALQVTSHYDASLSSFFIHR